MNRRARRGAGRSRQAGSMVISRMVPDAIHRGKAAGSGGLSIGTGLLHPARAHRLYTSDHSRELLRTGCVRRGRASDERRPQPRLFLHGRPRSRPPHSLRSAEAQPRSRLQNFIEPSHRSVRIFLGRKLDFSVLIRRFNVAESINSDCGSVSAQGFHLPSHLTDSNPPQPPASPPEPQGC